MRDTWTAVMAQAASPSSAKVAKSSNRGSKPGERRGGRKKGTPNKATAEIREIAQEYTTQAIEALADVMVNGESEAARVSAANALLDRGYGRPSQALTGPDGEAIDLVAILSPRRERAEA